MLPTLKKTGLFLVFSLSLSAISPYLPSELCAPIGKLSTSSGPIGPLISGFLDAPKTYVIAGNEIKVEATAPDSRTVGYQQAMDRLADNVREKTPYTPERVLYLFAGTDAGVFRAFPKAKLIIMQGQAPFSNSLKKEDLESLKTVRPSSGVFRDQFSSGWKATKSFDPYTGVGHEILGAMAGNIPDIRFRSVQVFERPSIDQKDVKTRTHAVIKFDQGVNTPLRHLVYFSEDNLQASYENSWWFSAIENSKPDTLYVKASDNAMGQPGPYSFRSRLTQVLTQSHPTPYVVESLLFGKGEFTSTVGTRKQTVNFTDFNTQQIQVGYENKFQILPIGSLPKGN